MTNSADKNEIIVEINTLLATLDDVDVSMLIDDLCTLKSYKISDDLKEILDFYSDKTKTPLQSQIADLRTASTSLNIEKQMQEVFQSLEILNSLTSTLSEESSSILVSFIDKLKDLLSDPNNVKQFLETEDKMSKEIEKIRKKKKKESMWDVFYNQYLDTKKIVNQLRIISNVKTKILLIYNLCSKSSGVSEKPTVPKKEITISWVTNKDSKLEFPQNNIIRNKILRNLSNTNNHLQPYVELEFVMGENRRLRNILARPDLEVDPQEALDARQENEKLKQRIAHLQSQLQDSK
ncbi:hypothetical protein TVAG_032720 [Trichomonas vaginalis G3]|uniref:Uncharacterized protein n=1 Tax=Trichomonas vaginalis (strain ATCC PRA-98 / G3) TaxID=412133 RepID=A2FMI7_TRIV3|nr:hypothetical protein TVAGG3_0054380 [Trichomonas vaginalis G3]EAX93886.1 hypothetical protein TVAG_032720 [Trichomonas vaginalis G3]KAI5541532.1 hypothetical protein TVAGG3_0054380 [Trichomonas vaginalis G3]|eukprot:XP_001306816.1 hypothetical protein [Trichomonas vaginalis G3]